MTIPSNWIALLIGLIVVVFGVLGLFSVAPFSATVIFALLVLLGAAVLFVAYVVPPPPPRA